MVLVGRPNVGKSTLFNRITRTRRAIVTRTPGTTRDLLAHDAEWDGVRFELVDTGGMFGHSVDPLHELVVQHGRRAIRDADVLVFVVDGREGGVAGDEAISEALRPASAPTMVAVNKTDDKRARGEAVEFYRFGFEPVLEISAEHGTGIAELLDQVVAQLRAQGRARAHPPREVEEPETAVAIVGRPNVGKSSLVNRLLREERVMVSEMPGTTRDAVDAVLRWHKRTFRIVDTAGIRRPGRVARSGEIEMVSVLAARRAIERADVAVLLVDATEGPAGQDAAIAGEADRLGCGVILAANKWDLVKERGAAFGRTFDEELRRAMKFLDYAPVMHISAATGERTPRLLEVIDRVAAERRHRVATADLNRWVAAVTSVHPPVSPGKRAVKILYAAQTGIAPPTFVFFTNVASSFHFSYERFLINGLRDSFGFNGTPIRVVVRKRGGRE
ncbi:MAG: ribosome biogenesis GTPase Der [Vicinamibacteraceae bacterium]